MKRQVVLVVFLFFFLVGISAKGEKLQGNIISVIDGDTVILLDNKQQQHKIRLDKIDAPELGHGKDKPGQHFGMESKESLLNLIYGQEVRANCKDRDRYGRLLCTLWLGSMNVNLEQVRRGMAWVYRKYCNDPYYYLTEDEARRAKRGLWQSSDAMAPWEYRHGVGR